VLKKTPRELHALDLFMPNKWLIIYELKMISRFEKIKLAFNDCRLQTATANF